MQPVGIVCEQLASTMIGAHPVVNLAWGIIRDGGNTPLYLVFMVFGKDNIEKVDNSMTAMNPGGKIETENVLYRVGSIGESIYGGMEATGRDQVHWGIGKNDNGDHLYLIGFVRGTVHVPKMNQLLTRIQASGALKPVPNDLALPELSALELPPGE